MKKVITAILAIAMALGLAACGGNPRSLLLCQRQQHAFLRPCGGSVLELLG